MRLTNILFKQHLGKMLRDQWEGVRKIRPVNLGTQENLEKKGIEVECALQFLPNLEKPVPKRPKIFIPVEKEIDVGPKGLVLGDNDVLVEGLTQAKVLTNSIEIPNGLPRTIEDKIPNKTPRETIALLQSYLFNACVFNFTQDKLPKYINPQKLHFNYKRQYGIPSYKKIELLLPKMVQHCEILSKRQQDRKNQLTLVKDTKITTTFNYEQDVNIVLDFNVEMIFFSGRPLPEIATPDELSFVQESSNPELDTIHPHISIQMKPLSALNEFFPVSNKSHHPHIHTAILYHDPTQVKNLFDINVKRHQIFGRTLMKTFALAIAQAKQIYGADVQEIPKPIVIQTILTDGCHFHFMVYQLNTLNARNSSKKNFFWQSKQIPLFTKCQYETAVPTMEGFDPMPFNILSAFYNHDIQ